MELVGAGVHTRIDYGHGLSATYAPSTYSSIHARGFSFVGKWTELTLL